MPYSPMTVDIVFAWFLNSIYAGVMASPLYFNFKYFTSTTFIIVYSIVNAYSIYLFFMFIIEREMRRVEHISCVNRQQLAV